MPTKKKQLQEYQIEKILQKRNIILFYQCSNAKMEEWETLKKSLLEALSKNASKMVETHLISDFSKTFVTLIVKNCLGQRCATSARLKVQGSILTNGKPNLEDFMVPIIFDQKRGKQGKQPLFSMTDDLCNTFPGVCNASCKHPDKLVEGEGWGSFFQGPTLLFACDSHHQMIVGCDAINKNENRHGPISLIGGIYYGKTMTHLDLAKMCQLDQGVYASLTCSLTENARLLLNERLYFYQSRLLFYLDCHAAGLCHIEGKSTISLK